MAVLGSRGRTASGATAGQVREQLPRRPLRDLLLALAGGLAGLAAIWVTHRGLIDDSYITLSYARTLAEHHTWGLTRYEQANSATSPLNVLLLAGSLVLVSHVSSSFGAVVALGLLTVVLGLFLGWSASRATTALRLAWPWALLVVVVVLADPFVLSALGLEVALLSTVLVALLAFALRGEAVAFGLMAGAAVLTRADLVVFVVALAVCSPRLWRRLGWSLLAAVVAALPWYAASWWALGSAIPDTFVIKTLQHSFGTDTYANGLRTLYWPRDHAAVLTSVAAPLLGVLVVAVLAVAALVRRSGGTTPLLGLGLGGIAYFAVYSELGVPPYQWYYVPPMSALAVTAALGVGVALRGRARPRDVGVSPRRWAGSSLAFLGALATVVGLLVSAQGRGLPWRYPPVFGNFATPASYLAAGRGLGQVVGSQGVQSPGEIGTLAFSCGCAMVDAFSDRGQVVPLIEQREARADPVVRELLRLNYHRLDTSIKPYPVADDLRWVDPGQPITGPAWPVDGPTRGSGHLVLVPVGRG